ncbi:hypothetical protein LTS10_010363 [Elasticomyces elasticus]|nr:hypothetical protein LTS10_010363 [Elasticomyces elasticus]
MDDSNQFVLYDAISEQGEVCWLPNPWKTRLLLNYKNLPYRTKWLKLKDVGEEIKALGVLPNAGRGKPYTIPVLKFPDGTLVMDSHEIAKRVERLYPRPSVGLDDDVLEEVTQLTKEILVSFLPDLIPLSRDTMDESGRAWFEADRSALLRMSCDEYARLHGGEVAWGNAEGSMVKLKAALNEHKTSEGPFVRGATVTQADFVVVSFLEWARVVGDGNIYRRMVEFVPDLARLRNACEPWFRGDKS